MATEFFQTSQTLLDGVCSTVSQRNSGKRKSDDHREGSRGGCIFVNNITFGAQLDTVIFSQANMASRK